MARTVVFVVLDSVRFDIFQTFISEYDDTFVHSLLEDGTEFRGATATAPWSLPSHASMFTGQYPREHGALRANTRITEDTETLLDVLSDEEFHTGCFTGNPFVHPDYGFDGWDEHRNHYSQTVYPDATAPKSDKSGLSELLDGMRQVLNADQRAKTFANAAYRKLRTTPPLVDDGGRRMTRDAINWLDDNAGEDLFLFLNYMETHDYHKRLTKRGRLRNLVDCDRITAINHKLGGAGISHYATPTEITERDRQFVTELIIDEIRYVDILLQRLWSKLETMDRSDDCLFILCSDHGDAFGERGFVYHLAGVTEPLVRAPLLVKSPNGQQDVVDERVSLGWLFDTIVDYAAESGNMDLFDPETYPEYVGAENTNRLTDLINGLDKRPPERYFRKRVAVYESSHPKRKYVRIGDEYGVRELDERTLTERDTDDEGEPIVQAFEDSLRRSTTKLSDIGEETESRLRELGYLN
ncbi:sulfatase-like hydrolase/transferase [Halorussus sp. AFM4]|uniref:sulfatase-like hydrolase/transferase n=1 Tax=Halorussus sp. AFM4 TaxID=3421651 RepID=UPI003EBE080C